MSLTKLISNPMWATIIYLYLFYLSLNGTRQSWQLEHRCFISSNPTLVEREHVWLFESFLSKINDAKASGLWEWCFSSQSFEKVAPVFLASLASMQISADYLKTPSGVLKIVEIVTVVIGIGLFRGSSAMFKLTSEDANYFGFGVLVTALIITPLLFVCYIMGRYEIQKTIFEMVFNFLMFVFLLSVGAATVDVFHGVYFPDQDMKRKSLTLGTICIISSLAYLGDTVCAVLLYRK